MGYFDSTIAAYLAGQAVSVAILVELDFLSSTVRMWSGVGDLYVGGQTWKGIGQLGQITGLESVIGDAAPVVTFTLSGVDPLLVGEALGASNEVKNRNCTISLQFFDANLAPLDSTYAIYVGVMDVMKIKADGPGKRTIELTSESIFSRRGFPVWGWLSQVSQQQLYPGDNGLAAMTLMQNVTTGWPWL